MSKAQAYDDRDWQTKFEEAVKSVLPKGYRLRRYSHWLDWYMRIVYNRLFLGGLSEEERKAHLNNTRNPEYVVSSPKWLYLKRKVSIRNSKERPVVVAAFSEKERALANKIKEALGGRGLLAEVAVSDPEGLY